MSACLIERSVLLTKHCDFAKKQETGTDVATQESKTTGCLQLTHIQLYCQYLSADCSLQSGEEDYAANLWLNEEA